MNRFLKEIRKGTLEIAKEMLNRQGVGVPFDGSCVFKMKSYLFKMRACCNDYIYVTYTDRQTHTHYLKTSQ